jgi:dihydroneopterin aldolase
MKDQIIIEHMEASCRIGVTEHERSSPQIIYLSIDMEFSVEKSSLSGSLQHTIDYAAVIDGLRRYLEPKVFVLIETLAQEAADWILSHYPVQIVRVQAMKTPFKDVGKVGVLIERRARKKHAKKKG